MNNSKIFVCPSCQKEFTISDYYEGNVIAKLGWAAGLAGLVTAAPVVAIAGLGIGIVAAVTGEAYNDVKKSVGLG